MTFIPTHTYDASTHEWVFSNGKRLPVVSGGDPTATPGSVVVLEGEPTTAPPAQPAPTVDPDNVFTKEQVYEMIEKARREEKEKLYPRLDTLTEQMKAFEEEKRAAEEAARAAQEQADAERRAQEEAEMSAKDLLLRKEDEWKAQMQTVAEEWEARFNAQKAESDAHRALLEREQRFQELKSFTDRRIAEESDNLMPELMDWIGGDSEEEIEASIQRVVAKTAAIVGNMQSGMQAVQPQRPRPITATGGSPSGPLENLTEQQLITVDDIRNMTMQEYAAHRDRLLKSTARR